MADTNLGRLRQLSQQLHGNLLTVMSTHRTIANAVKGAEVVIGAVPVIDVDHPSLRAPDDMLSAWFPAAAPRIYRDRDNRAWLDLLLTLEPSAATDAPKLIVYRRIDMTQALSGSR